MSDTTYKVEVGKGKGSYRGKYSFTKLPQARKWYDSVLVHSGGKKRLVKVNGTGRTVLEREVSQ